MSDLYYTFDGDHYAATDAGVQELLENISTALETEAWSDPELADATDDERQEASSMAFDGTHYEAAPWDNFMAIMQHAPYAVEVTRVEVEHATPEDWERATWLYPSNHEYYRPVEEDDDASDA